MQNTGKQAFSSRSCASNHRSSRREARMAAAWSAIHPLMAAFSTSRAATQSGGSFGSGHIRSRWCAPSGRMTVMSEFERLRVTPPLDHGSKSPCVKREAKNERRKTSAAVVIRHYTHVQHACKHTTQVEREQFSMVWQSRHAVATTPEKCFVRPHLETEHAVALVCNFCMYTTHGAIKLTLENTMLDAAWMWSPPYTSSN
jgi:hypothetical protein